MRDYLIRAITTNKEIKVLVANSTGVVKKAQQLHNTTPVATAALGRVLTAALLMGAMIKSGDKVGLKVIGNGPLNRIIAEANSGGEGRGFVGNPHAKTSFTPEGKIDVAKAVGEGKLHVRKVTGLKKPSQGSVPLISGEIGEDLTYYFTKSEQTPSSVGLGVLVDKDLKVLSAGGFIIQLLPEASDSTIERLEKNLGFITSVSRLLNKGQHPEDLLEELLHGFDYRIMADLDLQYKCNCSQENVRNMIKGFDQEELKQIIAEEGSVEVECHYCGKTYNFKEEEVLEND